jgi:hypothetical protein
MKSSTTKTAKLLDVVLADLTRGQFQPSTPQARLLKLDDVIENSRFSKMVANPVFDLGVQ